MAAVRDVGSQLQRLTQALERDQQEREPWDWSPAQLVEAAQGLGQLGEVVKETGRGGLAAYHTCTNHLHP